MVVVAIGILFTALPFLESGDRILGMQVKPPPGHYKVSMTLNVDSIDFGSMDNGASDDTLDFAPGAFELENDGQAKLDVRIEATNLWDSEQNPSTYFQFQSAEKEVGAVDDPSTDLVTVWTNVPETDNPVFAVRNFNKQNPRDEVYVHIRVEVPLEEGAGVKSTEVKFTISPIGE